MYSNKIMTCLYSNKIKNICISSLSLKSNTYSCLLLINLSTKKNQHVVYTYHKHPNLIIISSHL